MPRRLVASGTIVACAALLGGCGIVGGGGGGGGPKLLVSTTLIGDLMDNLLEGDVTYRVLIPGSTDPHEFEPSAKLAERLASAEVIVAVGGGFEGGSADVIDGADDDDTDVVRLVDLVDTLPGPGGEGVDPHIWTDPSRMAEVVRALVEPLSMIDGVDAEALGRRADDYAETLEDLDAEIKAKVDEVPTDRRVIVTDHPVLTYFADRYGIEVVGSIAESPGHEAEPSAKDLKDLADEAKAAGVKAIVVEANISVDVAKTLAQQAGAKVLTLNVETLGDSGEGADTYVGLVRTLANRIIKAL